jgi:protein CpxP
MSFNSLRTMRLLAATAGFALTVGLAGVAHAQTATTTTAAPADAAAAAPVKHKRTKTETVESRIARLHSRLGITAAEETQWTAVADAMRANAKEFDALQSDNEAHPAQTAPDFMSLHQKELQVDTDSAQRLNTAFATLYNSFSDDQKKNADTIFQNMNHRHHRPKKTQ